MTDTESAEEELTDADLDGIVGAGGRVKDLPGVGEPYIVVEVDPD